MSQPVDRRELLKDAVRAVEQMRERVVAMERAASEPIAVVGIGCRLPGGAGYAGPVLAAARRGRRRGHRRAARSAAAGSGA